MNKNRLLFSGIGVVIVFISLILFNFIASKVPVRLDFTEDGIYTLSESSEKILAKVDAPVTINFYCTRSANSMPVYLKNYASRVEDMLNEYVQASNGMVEVFKHDPTPDSDAEDAARQDGVEGQMVQTGDRIYLGLSISCIDKTEVLPFLSSSRENLMEYDITSAISRVVKTSSPVIGVMSALPVMGQQAPFNPMMMRGQQPPQGQAPWIFVSELKKDYEVKEVGLDVSEIPSDVTTLIIFHPNGISEECEYAIDQFVLKGGKVIAFVDPSSYYAMNEAQNNPAMRQQVSSNLPKLFKAWGIEVDESKVVADASAARNIRTQQGQFTLYGINDFTSERFNKDDAIISQIKTMAFVYGGAITGDAVEGLTKTSLVTSSDKSGLLNAFVANNPVMAGRNFKVDGKHYDMAVRLTGKFKTAFPDGKPNASEDEKKNDKSVKESEKDGYVVVVADTDLLFDQICVNVQRILGQQLVTPVNGNLNFAQNLIDSMAGDEDMIGIRSRQSADRPFTKVKELQAQANQKFKEQIEAMDAKVRDAQRRINELQRNKKDSSQRFILSPEQESEIKKLRSAEAESRKEAKRLRKELRKDINSLETTCKWLNIALMPMLITILGLVVAFNRKRRSSAK